MSHLCHPPIRHLFTSESVSEGHPDKVCDQISDAVLDAHLAVDPMARVACETAVKSSQIFLLGEITSRAETQVNYADVVKAVLQHIGYGPEEDFGPDQHTLHSHISAQSVDIDAGVSQSQQGAGDQGMMFGFACDETPTYMPLPIHLAHSLARTLSEQRKSGTLPWLRPDGKVQVTVEYRNGIPHRLHTVVISAQHAPDIENDEINAQLHAHVLDPVLTPTDLRDEGLIVHINPTGRFVVGGPAADAGLTGRKIIVDTYGGMGRHGGGAFSGKDCTKVDRSAAYMARLVAKCVVAVGLARRCEVQLAYAIGYPEPVSVLLETSSTGKVSDVDIAASVQQHFDLSPQGIVQELELHRPIYRPTATYGHFGRPDLALPWEDLTRGAAARFMAAWS